MKRILGLLFVTMLGSALVPAADVAAGGWAVTTLDALPAVRAGETVAVGFVIRQHGVTPVALDDVRVEVRSPSGQVRAFDAARDGAVGHYVAEITFPETGDVRWSVIQGWFGPQELGTLSVGDAATSAGATRPAWPDAVRVALPVLAAIAALVAILDAFRSHRRRSQVLA